MGAAVGAAAPRARREAAGAVVARRSSSEALPAAGRALQRVLLGAGREQDQLTSGLLMGEHASEIAVREPARLTTRLQRPLDALGAVNLGEVDGLDRLGPAAVRARRCALAPDARRARGGGLDQPGLGGRSDLKERLLLGLARPRAPLQGSGRLGWVVPVIDRRAAWCGQPVASDLLRSLGAVGMD